LIAARRVHVKKKLKTFCKAVLVAVRAESVTHGAERGWSEAG
jgi:hypothetical protein